MAVFDITPNILKAHGVYDPYNRDPITLRSAMSSIREWLEDNVGECYGPGDDHVVTIGAGWEIFRMYDGKPRLPRGDHDTSITWHVDITDEQKAVMFALKWTTK